MHKRIANLFILILLAIPYCLQASPTCSKWLATAVSIQGKVDTQYSESPNWNPIIMGHHFCYGDKVRTSKHSRATLIFKNGPRITLDQNSTLSFSSTTKKKTSWIINLLSGSSFIRSRQSHRLNVQTPFINAVHEGTEFLVSVNSKQTKITVFDGQVAATNPMGKIHIKKGHTGIATNTQAPYIRSILIRPEDTVQWSLYYPPIIDVSTFTQAIFQPSLEAYKQGNLALALSELEKTPKLKQNIDYLSLKSSLLLSLGSVDEALKTINQIIQIAPDNSISYALQSMIAVTKNRQKKAFTLAEKAVTLHPQSATTQIALSYAYQAKFKIASALTATEKAVNLSPNNALAWARLAELQLSNGQHNDALNSAKKAHRLNPLLAHTQTVLGFSYLAQIDIDNAKIAFAQAISLNSADPLAHLGLGLAKIRKGAIEEGSQQIETAVSLDPGNAMMRNYLGKAYYELKNDQYAATELNIAKEIDPNDPTPWFYDAIRKQTTNRPVEALHDMQKAIELNDNRGVYRSKLLLDEDLAARSASLGRIYNDLDTKQLALVEGWNSVNTDPRNHSAHRLLADNYSTLPKHDLARISELLQSQLLQPINITPIQPHLAENNLLILDGVGSTNQSFNEYNPLFTSNRFSLQASGLYGGNNTWGNEVVQSGVWNQFSYSLGQLHYETDGFRKNNDLTHDIYSGFFQSQVSPKLSLLAEIRYRDTESGDLLFQFDPEEFSDNKRSSIRNTTVRTGGRYKISSNQDIIGVFTYNKNHTNSKINRQELIHALPAPIKKDINISLDLDVTSESDSYSGELQYILNKSNFNLILGGGRFEDNRVDNELLINNQTTSTTISFPFPARTTETLNKDIKSTSIDASTKHSNVYLYINYNLFDNIIWTTSISYDNFDQALLDESRFSPKIGLSWQIFQGTTLRTAWFKTLKRTQTSATIEPTQIAGFNQLSDGTDGAKVTHYGFGIDQVFSPNLYSGLEFTVRKFKRPIIENMNSNLSILNAEHKEEVHRAYIFYTPNDKLSLGAEYNFEHFDTTSESCVLNCSAKPLTDLLTHQVPLTINYTNPLGFFTNFTVTYINQKVNFLNDSEKSGSSNFWLFDTSIGYRLPKRYGIARLGVKNIFNNSFKFHALNNQTGEPLQPVFQPERILFGQITINF